MDRPWDIVFLSAYPAAHYGTVARFTPWTPHLERLGCRVAILTPTSSEQFAAYGAGDVDADIRFFRACLRTQWRNIRRAARADAVVLHRGVFPFSPWQRPTFERLLARLNPRLVYDFYDTLWIDHRRKAVQPSRVARWLNPADKIEEIIRIARVVTVSNEPLAEFARLHHRDVRILPVMLEPDAFEPRRHENRSPVVLGWSGGRGNLGRLLALAPALQRLAANRDIVLRVRAPAAVEIPGVRIEPDTRPWSPEVDRENFAAMDIGLMPLEDTEIDRGKSPLKLLQYSAAGLAIVATPIAIDLSVMRPGESFLAATSEDEWVAAMTRLVDEPELRGRLGGMARKTLEEHYSFHRHASSFLDALRTAAEHGSRER
jgi:glycosyltransferase involved in cell wall biosynthesis